MAEHEESVLTKEEAFVIKRLVWHGTLRRKDIENLLKISSDFASRVIGRVRRIVGTESQGRAYVLDARIPEYVTANGFLEDVRRSMIFGLDMEKEAGTEIPAFILSAPDQHIDVEVLHDIVGAIKNRKALGITYTGTRLGETRKNRVIEPVALVLINERWHVHAYAVPEDPAASSEPQEKGGWRDFVLSRISRSYGTLHAATHTLESSQGIREESILVKPHPDLTSDQKEMIEKAWNMQNGQLKLKMTGNQLFYFRKNYVASTGEQPPEKLLVEIDQEVE